MISVSVTGTLDNFTMPETWRQYLNGPQPGTINVEAAKKEMPWLVGCSGPVHATGGLNLVGNAAAQKGAGEPPAEQPPPAGEGNV